MLFSNTQFLEEVKDERSSRNRLKHLLVLASRLFAIAFLVFAFAQPFIPFAGNKSRSEKYVSIFIDNSYSMNAEGNGRLLFDEAKLAAKDILNAYSDNNRFQILTQDFEGKHQRFVSKSEALNLLEEVKSSPAGQSLAAVYERQRSLLNKETGSKTLYLLSDFQKNQNLFNNDTSIIANLIPFYPKQVRNIYIDSVWFEAPIQLTGQNNQFAIKLVNAGNERSSGNYQLSLNGASKSVSTYEIDPGSFFIDTLSFTITDEGWNEGEVSLNDYPITFDDDYYFSFFVEKEVNVLRIGESSDDKIFKAVFEEIENIKYQSVSLSGVNYNGLNSQHLVVLDRLSSVPTGLNAALKDFVIQGGNVFLAPTNNASIPSYNQFLAALNIGSFSGVNETARAVTKMNTLHPALSDLFDNIPNNLKLPEVQRHFNLRLNSGSAGREIFTFRNGDIFMNSFSLGNGDVYVLTAPLSKAYSDFVTHPVFAPIVYKMAILGVSSNNIAYEIKPNTTILVDNAPSSAAAIIKMSQNELELIPQQMVYNGSTALRVKGDLLRGGFYDLYANNSDFNGKVAINYNRKESDLTYYSEQELKDAYRDNNIQILGGNLAEITEKVKQQEKGKSFWKLCIVLSLLFLAIEILLLRFLKN